MKCQKTLPLALDVTMVLKPRNIRSSRERKFVLTQKFPAYVQACKVYLHVHTIHALYNILVSWLRGRSKENWVYISHVAQVSDTVQVTRQVPLLGLIE